MRLLTSRTRQIRLTWDYGPYMMNMERLQEIRRFHAALSTAYRSDPTAISAFESQAAISIMAELISHAEETVQP